MGLTGKPQSKKVPTRRRRVAGPACDLCCAGINTGIIMLLAPGTSAASQGVSVARGESPVRRHPLPSLSN